MSIIELIERKRDGGELSELDIAWLIGSYSRDEIPDYQMAALLMAVYLNGLNAAELAAWTEAMLHSGEVM
ncbi:MAG: thymidine phosphorylase, partial [Acidimicrobiia bacterium]|nr:thymidine phosphorylase [Acidimicrobiia bacterium]